LIEPIAFTFFSFGAGSSSELEPSLELAGLFFLKGVFFRLLIALDFSFGLAVLSSSVDSIEDESLSSESLESLLISGLARAARFALSVEEKSSESQPESDFSWKSFSSEIASCTSAEDSPDSC
jgi:hypothetical protein